jgi:hypothetical protein
MFRQILHLWQLVPFAPGSGEQRVGLIVADKTFPSGDPSAVFVGLARHRPAERLKLLSPAEGHECTRIMLTAGLAAYVSDEAGPQMKKGQYSNHNYLIQSHICFINSVDKALGWEEKRELMRVVFMVPYSVKFTLTNYSDEKIRLARPGLSVRLPQFNGS